MALKQGVLVTALAVSLPIQGCGCIAGLVTGILQAVGAITQAAAQARPAAATTTPSTTRPLVAALPTSRVAPSNTTGPVVDTRAAVLPEGQ